MEVRSADWRRALLVRAHQSLLVLSTPSLLDKTTNNTTGQHWAGGGNQLITPINHKTVQSVVLNTNMVLVDKTTNYPTATPPVTRASARC